MKEQSPIFSKCYDLLVWMIPVLSACPKEHRFRLAARIEDSLFEMHEALICASRQDENRSYLQQADIQLERLRHYLRLAQQVRCLSFGQYEHAARMAAEVGRLLGGWMKACRDS